MRVASHWLAAAVVLGGIGAAACGPAPRPNTVAISRQIYQDELNAAREALARSEWVAARERLDGLVDALGPQDPIGAEARAALANVAFELGDYARAIDVAGQVPADSPFRAAALESRGLAQLFSCDFDHAIETFYQLAQVDPPRGRVWLGVAYAWTGADANAERELTWVVENHGQSEHGPNARFYLTQLALWGRRAGPAQRYLSQLRSTAPNYLATLDQRAQNWLQRRAHLMRAYFSFDTMARLALMTQAPELAAHEQHANEALSALQQNPGACGAQVQRLAAARAAQARTAAAMTRDRDGDGIPDVRDRCVDQAETRNAFEDEDGCPEDTAAIEVVGNQIRIRSGFALLFATREDRVLPESRPVLDQIAAVLRSPSYSWIRRIRLDGHTDDVGDEADNMALGQRRVQAVGAALVGRGVDRNKLTFRSYGESRPIDPSGTEEARARNRRVEIFIIEPAMFGGVRADETAAPSGQ
jgi:outer membrane protein OmpA-like peptidoglycan-associated protein